MKKIRTAWEWFILVLFVIGAGIAALVTAYLLITNLIVQFELY